MSRRICFDFGDGVIPLPKEKLLGALPTANEFNLKVLLLTAADDRLRSDYDACCAELRTRLDCTQSALERAFAYWNKSGLLTVSEVVAASAEAAAAQPADTPRPAQQSDAETKSKKTLQSASLPAYSESQCADILAASPDLPDTIDMCQQILQKIFTPSDVAIIVALYDHLGLGGEYIASLCAFCAGNGKKSLRYIERTAINLFDEGVDTLDALNAYIKKKEDFEENLSKIRRLIGAGSRELTAKEKKAFACWLDEWGFGIDIITRAYEITVDKISEPSVAYINRVLENWHKSGLNTLEAVEASLETYKKNKLEAAHDTQTINGTESGFQTDEFFEAALRRSYKENP